MAETTAKTGEDIHEARLKASRRRDKPQLSCTLCRQKNSAQARALSVQDRIRRLERLVVSLAETPDAVTSKVLPNKELNFNDGDGLAKALYGADASTQEVGEHFGRLSVDESETRYVNPSHWEAILEDITEIKDAISSPGTTDSSSKGRQSAEDLHEPELLFGQRERMSFTDIVCSLPSKSVVDELIQTFLKSLDIPPLTLHVPTFEKEYIRFWEEPESMSLTWLGLLHTVMALSLHFIVKTNKNTVADIKFPDLTARLYTKRAATCLILADYSKPTTYTVEAMIMYMGCEHFLNPENEFRASLLFTLVLRLAMRAGYHRDPTHYTSMSIFEGEMRRRIWALITQLDLVFSSSLGLPRLVDDRQADTIPPLSVLDEDLDPNMTEPPKPRPETEQTWVGFMNYKTKMLGLLGEIVDHANSVHELPYSDVLQLEKKIQANAATKPVWLELPKDGSLATLPLPAMSRLVGLDLITQRARMVLHRKFLTADKSYAYSRECCLAAASQALQHQWNLFEMSREPDGIVSSSWRFFSLMSHDFLMAAMIICLDLDQTLLRGGEENDTEEDKQEKTKRFDLLQKSYKIWTESADDSGEARKAAEVVRVMLGKVKTKRAGLDKPSPGPVKFDTPNYTSETASTMDQSSLINEAKETMFPPTFQSLGPKPLPGPMTIDDLNLGAPTGYPMDFAPTNTDAQVFQSMIASPENFDWLEWDSQFAAPALELPT